MDWGILVLSYFTIGASIFRTIVVNETLDKLLVQKAKFENFDALTYCQELFNQASALVVFFSWVKVTIF